jgi:DNA-directed RNA polymerase subunit K/omega
VVQRPADFSAFEFAVLASLRADQLSRRDARVRGSEKIAVTAQQEVAERKIVRTLTVAVVGP